MLKRKEAAFIRELQNVKRLYPRIPIQYAGIIAMKNLERLRKI